MKSLVVYFSRKGHVKKVAEERAKELGADLYEVKTAERTKGYLGFWWCGRFGMHRWEMDIKECLCDIESYDKVIICSPIWVLTICAPIRAFINRNAGKIKSVDYILVHFSFPMKYKVTVKQMDETLGLVHERFTSIACQWGKCWRKREF